MSTSNPSFRAAILVVSTTASKDASADSSGPILKEVFETVGDGKWEVVDTRIVGDVIEDIQSTIKGWTDGDNPPSVIISTGGTGFAVFDTTPEVCQTHLIPSHAV